MTGQTSRLLFIAALWITIVASTPRVIRTPILGFGIIYVVFFMAITWKRPAIGLCLAFALAPFNQDVGVGLPVAMAIGEINVAICFLVFVLQNIMRHRPMHAGPLTIPIGLYLSVCIISSAGTWRGASALTSIFQMLLYFEAAVVVFAWFANSFRDYMPALYGLVCVGVLISLAVITTGYTFDIEKNHLGGSLAMAFVVCLELWISVTDAHRVVISIPSASHRVKDKLGLGRIGLGLALLSTGAGLVLSLSRGAWLGALAAVCIMLIMHRRTKLAAQIASAAIPVIVLCWISLPQAAQDYASNFSTSKYNIQARFNSEEFALAQFDSSPVYGSGVGLRKEFDATNLVLTTLAETGVLGLITLAAIYIAYFMMIWDVYRRLPPNDPLLSILIVSVGCVVCHLGHGMVDHYWTRGALLNSWAAVGMAVAVHHHVCRRPAPTPVPVPPRPKRPETWRRRR